MKFLRSHILKVTVVTLLLSGFGFCFVQPAQSNSNSRAFASWLSAMASQSDMAEVRAELDQLKQSGAQLSQIIERATRIVTDNNEEFSFALQKAVATQQVYQFLLIEWNQFKTDNTMANLPVRPSVKISIPFSVDKAGAFFAEISTFSNTAPPVSHIRETVKALPVFQLSIIPMADGIAIGAP